MITFLNKKEFEQASIDCVARIIFDDACSIMSDGNICDVSEELLGSLKYISCKLSLSTKSIDTYLSIITDNNSQLYELDELGELDTIPPYPPHGKNQGNKRNNNNDFDDIPLGFIPRVVTRG